MREGVQNEGSRIIPRILPWMTAQITERENATSAETRVRK